MIPKIIHYVWVGNAPKPELVLKCIASWKTHLPDYQIVEWNNDSVHALDNTYMQQAFAAGKWAFVSDYLRLYALQQYGGFYFDTDLEITADLDAFRQHDFVTGFEQFKKRLAPVTALMGATANNPVIRQLLQPYTSKQFIKADGQFDLTPNTGLISDIFAAKFGLVKPYNANHINKLTDNAFIYPSHYFCTPEAGKPGYAIHHFNGSWFEEYSRKLLFSIKEYKFIRLKRNKIRSALLPLQSGETKIWQLGLNARYSLLVVHSSHS
ncbi:glycosyltransferase family 32 protein [Rheinheimera sp. EpRS3]|uniref:glycosyltransferase family 32 protein n=1 Tax=Rheinheimera sp. EpRS3 TaxID=1712383 RepID=UPI000749F5B2|nr:glycosyltransferase [Rheinheimera sp. EpRS3]KUM53386.1 hypothetical protein AR688_05570 [Rheinheimera sp. EpRS3]